MKTIRTDFLCYNSVFQDTHDFVSYTPKCLQSVISIFANLPELWYTNPCAHDITRPRVSPKEFNSISHFISSNISHPLFIQKKKQTQ